MMSGSASADWRQTPSTKQQQMKRMGAVIRAADGPYAAPVLLEWTWNIVRQLFGVKLGLLPVYLLLFFFFFTINTFPTLALATSTTSLAPSTAGWLPLCLHPPTQTRLSTTRQDFTQRTQWHSLTIMLCGCFSGSLHFTYASLDPMLGPRTLRI